MTRTHLLRLRPLLPLVFLFTALALLLPPPSSSWASLAGGRVPGPELISPPAGATVQESGLRFAWKPATAGARHLLLLSRGPFDTRGWTRLPDDPAIQVHALEHPVASLEEVGVRLDADAQLYWAAASEDAGTGRLSFSEVRPCFALRRFANQVEPSPFLRQLSVGAVAPESSPETDRIRLAAGYTIDPRLGEPALPEQLRGYSLQGTAERTYLVYFGAADPERTRERILESGGSVVGYVPDHTFLVRMRATSQISLESEGWVGAFQPAYKLSPRLDLGSPEPGTVNVLVFPDGDLKAVAAEAQASGGRVLVSSDNGINKILRVSASGALLTALAQHPDVAWIEPYVRPVMDNGFAQYVVQTNAGNNRRVWDLGIHGEGQVIMTSDSGVEVGHNQYRDPNVSITTFGDYPTHRKIIAYKLGSSNPGVAFGDQSSAGYHGSHTGCTAVGNDEGYGTSANDGMAKAGKLYFMDISGPALGNGVDPFPDLNDLFLPSYLGNAGGAARISSNSWGSTVAGAYDLNALNVDQFMWNHPDYLIFCSNGNSGSGGSVGSPATAKSSVGAGGVRNGTLSNQIYASTSRGPTQDGRRKPTLCSPGQSVTSATSAPATYSTYSGTSMASPSMAGAALLIRQYCTEGWYPTGAPIPANGFAPSAALLKSMCVNSGNNQVTGFQAPDNNIGYGRINADSVLYFSGDQRRLLMVDYTAGLGHHQSIEYQVNVTDGAIPLKVALCWTDYPGNPLVLAQLVNDLDLTVTNGVVTYRGNSFTNGVSNTLNVVDHVNVEEVVRVAAPAAGLWTVRIDGYSVPAGPQPFGLCITGGIGTTGGTVALDRASYGSASTVQLRVTDTNAGPGVTVALSSSTEPAGETITLTGANGVFTGSAPLSPFAGSPGDGTLQVSSGDLITATYVDASPSATLTATAQVSFNPPVITAVSSSNQGNGAMLVTWTTDQSASSRVYYGPTGALGLVTALDPAAALQHQMLISGLAVGQTYFYDVESQDLNGNLTRDDNGGAHYQFTVNPPADLLLVYSGSDFERAARYTDALGRFNWSYDTWKGPLSESPQIGDLAGGLRSYQVVWWQVGLENYPPFSDAARGAITQYLDGGGRLAVVGNDIAWSYGDATTPSPFYSVERRDWMANTLHTLFVADTPGWVGLSGVAGDPTSGDYTGGLEYQEHRSGASGDQIDPSPGDGTAALSWTSIEAAPYSCGLRWESNGPRGTAGTAVWGGTPSRLSGMFFEWSGINSGAESDIDRARILDKTLTWLLGRERPLVTVVAPNGGSTITSSPISIEWTESTSAGTGVSARAIDYSVDGGQSWVTLTTSAGPSPYLWNLASAPNTATALVRVRVTDDGTPAFSGFDRSDAVFAIERAGGDLLGPAVMAGSIRVNPNPVNNQQPAALTATISDSLSGGGNVAAAEYSFGDAPAPAGGGIPMTGSFDARTVAVSASMFTGYRQPGTHQLYVRGRDAAGNWGNATALTVVVNGPVPLSVGGPPRMFELKQNAPNPVFQSTVISFAVPVETPVQLLIYDLQGRRVRTLVRQPMQPGVHHVRWDRIDDAGQRVGPGLYYYRLLAGGRSFERRMVALR